MCNEVEAPHRKNIIPFQERQQLRKVDQEIKPFGAQQGTYGVKYLFKAYNMPNSYSVVWEITNPWGVVM